MQRRARGSIPPGHWPAADGAATECDAADDAGAVAAAGDLALLARVAEQARRSASAAVPAEAGGASAAASATAVPAATAAAIACATPRDLSTTCPSCGTQMQPEHAHYRCGTCGYRDSCCF
jgi:hypothetical protein